MRKTVDQVIKEKGLCASTLPQYLIGKKMRVINMGGGHNYGPVGTVFKATCANNINWGTPVYVQATPTGNSLYLNAVEFCSNSAEEINEEIKENEKRAAALLSENDNLKLRLEFMKENGMKEFDEEVFKTFGVLKTLDQQGLTNLERAKIIAKIIKG